MNTRMLLVASASALGAAGVAASFVPHEILTALGQPARGVLPALVQVLGALWLAFAMVNWMSRGNAIGGIYNRPIAVGNFTHFFIGAITLTKLALAGGAQGAVLAAAALYVVFAVAFGFVLFTSPRQAG